MSHESLIYFTNCFYFVINFLLKGILIKNTGLKRNEKFGLIGQMIIVTLLLGAL